MNGFILLVSIVILIPQENQANRKVHKDIFTLELKEEKLKQITWEYCGHIDESLTASQRVSFQLSGLVDKFRADFTTHKYWYKVSQLIWVPSHFAWSLPIPCQLKLVFFNILLTSHPTLVGGAADSSQKHRWKNCNMFLIPQHWQDQVDFVF